MKQIKSSERPPQSGEVRRLTYSSLRQSESNWKQEDETEQKYHPRSVRSFCESAEQSKSVRGESDRNQSCCRPSEKSCERVRQCASSPAKAARDGSAAQHRNALHRERAGKEQREQKKDDARELALHAGRARVTAIVRDQARVE